MCTAITYKTKDHYFGRTLDLYYSYSEKVVITPRNCELKFRGTGVSKSHFAIIGIGIEKNNYPLYYDAVNEKGLAMAGLNFPGFAYYNEPSDDGRDNIAVFELIPWILSQCTDVDDALKLIKNINITNETFSDELPTASLHWIIADRERAITVESLKDGLKIYDNPVGVLTNSPTFDFHMHNLAGYMGLTPKPPVNRFSDKIDLKPYSFGMGVMGLPGDVSSASRFIRTAFTKLNSISGDSENESVSQFFHILGTVEQVTGCTDVGNETYEITEYTACCNVDKGIYYYTTYSNSRITAIDMNKENLDGSDIITYELIKEPQILEGN